MYSFLSGRPYNSNHITSLLSLSILYCDKYYGGDHTLVVSLGYYQLQTRNMFNQNIKKLTKENVNFRQVLHTGQYSQIVAMCLPVGGDIGMEVHKETDQMLFFIDGEGEAVLNGEKRKVEEHDVVFVPAGTKHNFINTGDKDLKLFTVYAPPAHPDGTVQKTKEEAEKAEKEESEGGKNI